MASRVNVLIFPCGAENALEIHDALKYSLHVTVFGMSSVEDYGEILFDKYIGGAPRVSDSGFKIFFEKQIIANRIDVVFPTHDTVLEFLAPICKELGVYLVNGDPITAQITRSKSKTYQTFKSHAWCPVVYDKDPQESVFPLIVKPDRGQGAQGVFLCNSPEELRHSCRLLDTPVVVEYLPGEEITVDCFTDRNRRLLWVGPRTRERVRSGISMRTRHIPLKEDVLVIASHINKRLLMRGPWFFQLKRDVCGCWKLLEISGRVAGTMVFQRARGINLPLMAIHDFLGRDVVPLPNLSVTKLERRIISHVNVLEGFRRIYIDLDDTLVVDGCANPVLMHFIYKCKSDNKQVVLITRHANDPIETLKRVWVDPDLFDEIIHLRNEELKSAYVTPDSVFVDNHFPERKDVFERVGALVLDVDAIQFHCF